MFVGNRLRNYALGLAAGLLLAIYIGSRFWIPANEQDALIQRQAAEHTGEYAKAAQIAVRQECASIEAPAEQRDCIAKEREPYRVAQRNERDLEAQQVMSNWTRAMGQAAIIGMGIGIVGLFLIFTTFWETRKAAESAGKTYRAFVKVERPTLIPSLTGLSDHNDPKKGRGKIVYIEINNLGKGDAVLKEMSWAFMTDEGAIPQLTSRPLAKRVTASEPYKPGFFKSGTKPGTSEIFEVMLRYESVFSPSHWTRRQWRLMNGIATEVSLERGQDDAQP